MPSKTQKKQMMMRDKICRLALLAIVALFAFSSCGINLVVMVGGAGERDLTGKCIQTYKPSKLGGKNDFNIRIDVPDTISCDGLDYCQFFEEEAFSRK